MTFDWSNLVERLTTQSAVLHRFQPPCSLDTIRDVQQQLGALPHVLKDMLTRFNGALLFDTGLPMITLFRASKQPPLRVLEWAPDWCIDVMTPKWRAGGATRKEDWAFGMTSYGGLLILDGRGRVKEWDTAEGAWLIKSMAFDKWIAKILKEGKELIEEE